MNNYLVDNYLDENGLEKKALREGFGEEIANIAALNDKIVVLNADLPGSLKLELFEEGFPDRYFQVGVAEQNMAGIGTGLAHYGKIPFITSFAAFSPGLNFSQIRLAAISRLPLKIVGSHYGLNMGKDGATAQMESDVALMKALPGMVVINPADYEQTKQAVRAMSTTKDISYLRVTREKFPVFIRPESEFVIGKAQLLLPGEAVTLIATGSMVYESLMAAMLLAKEGIMAEVLNIHTIKPLDVEAIAQSARKTGKVVVVEEHNIFGGLAESVALALALKQPTPMRVIAINDVFGESGEKAELWKKYGLDRESIVTKIREFVE